MIDIKKIEKLINKAQQFPAIAHTYALEVDRLLRASGEKPITFSANGWAENDMGTVERFGLLTKFSIVGNSLDQKAILSAENLIKKDMRTESLAHVFKNASGSQINALNLFYANHTTQDPETRLYYLNKYLNTYSLGIKLRQDIQGSFFYRLATSNSVNKVDGPLVTIIMPAHNAEKTIELAVNSLIGQSWQNLQIIIIDDASADSTLQKAKELAKRDVRIEVLSSPVNVGPYVCRNLGVLYTRGEWLTVHDADDWAFPDRIEQQVKILIEENAVACADRMLRMNEIGQITRPTIGSSKKEDGYLRLCFVSLMVKTDYFRNELGAWDSVRVGGDAELIERINAMSIRTSHLHRPLMLCLDNDAGLTNHPEFGLVDETGKKLFIRNDYKKAFTNWHKTPSAKKLSVLSEERLFEAPKANLVEHDTIKKILCQFSEK